MPRALLVYLLIRLPLGCGHDCPRCPGVDFEGPSGELFVVGGSAVERSPLKLEAAVVQVSPERVELSFQDEGVLVDVVYRVDGIRAIPY